MSKSNILFLKKYIWEMMGMIMVETDVFKKTEDQNELYFF